MKNSCIPTIANEPLLLVRKWQVDFCEGNTCAASVLSFFVYWYDIKLESNKKNKAINSVANAHGEKGTQDVSFLQFHTVDDIESGILGFYKVSSIRKAIQLLEKFNVVSVQKNPNPKYSFDNTNYFKLNIDTILSFLTDRTLYISDRQRKNKLSSCKNNGPSCKNTHTRTETTTETSLKIFSKEKSKNQNSCKSEEFIFNGLFCPKCFEKQFETFHGDTCKNGHGGLEGIEKPPTKKRRRKKKILQSPTEPIPTKTKEPVVNLFGYSDETFDIINYWKSYGGNFHKSKKAVSGPRLIEYLISGLLIEGRNEYIKVCDNPELSMKKWSIVEIKQCIKYYAHDLKKPIDKMYFSDFVIFRWVGKMRKKKDYSPLAESFVDLPNEVTTERSKKLKARLQPQKPNENIPEVVWIRAATFLEKMDLMYEVTQEAGWTRYVLNNLFIGYVEEFIRHDSNWKLSYIAGEAFLKEFIEKKKKSYMLKRRELAN